MSNEDITDQQRFEYMVENHHLGASYAGIGSINVVVHLDDYREGGLRHAIDCMIERANHRNLSVLGY